MIANAEQHDRKRRAVWKALTDSAGNTVAIMAAALLPLSAMVGSAVDMSRLYVVKARLQQACDAGALAGRKFMTGNSLDNNAKTQAKNFFSNNFASGFFTTTAVSFTPSNTSDGQVHGDASATVPMSIMRMFGKQPVTLNVSCEARLDLADVDVMFVLDTTGSMSCDAAGSASCVQPTATYIRPDGTTGYYAQEVSNSKLQNVRDAVLNFYDTMAGAADPSTHIRYGFVPYTSTVNVGYQIAAVNQSYLINGNWSYQSRRWIGDTPYGSPSTSPASTNVSQTTCNSYAGRSPGAGYNGSNQTWVTATVTTVSWSSQNGGSCTKTTQTVVPNYTYGPVSYNIDSFVAGNSVVDPTKVWPASSKWQGCIEERDTAATATIDPANLPADLDPDLVPSSTSTKWRPMWPEVVYMRTPPPNPAYNATQTTSTDDSYDNTGTYGNFNNWYFGAGQPSALGAGISSCGKPAQRLAALSRSQVSAYVNAADFKPIGGTYHDTGMIWGTRLISPSGVFAADTAPWPNRNPPNRNIIFMTDGVMAPALYIYGMYGVEYFDQRVTAGSFSEQTARHNARFVAECNAAKARNITVWVIAFSSATTLTPEMQACASPGKAYYASNNAALQTAFQNIAKQIAELRITK